MRASLTLALLLIAGCASVPATLTAPTTKAAQNHVKSQKLVGTTSFDGGTLQSDALVVVQLVGTDADGNLVVLGSDRITPDGSAGPIAYEVAYARTQLPGLTGLQVYAEILDALGNARWTGADPLLGDAIPSRYDMYLEPVRLTQKGEN